MMSQTWFALGTFDAGAGEFPGMVVGDTMYDIRGYLTFPYSSMREILADWDSVYPALAAMADASAGSGIPASGLTVRPPVVTGLPPGSGSHHGRYLRPGDVMECEIDGLGLQRTRCVAEPGSSPAPSAGDA